MNINKILSLPAEERDNEIRKLAFPEQWKQIAENCPIEVATRTMCRLYPLDANLAFKMRNEAVAKSKNDWIEAKTKVYQAIRSLQASDNPVMDALMENTFFASYAEPTHYILAAIMAGDE